MRWKFLGVAVVSVCAVTLVSCMRKDAPQAAVPTSLQAIEPKGSPATDDPIYTVANYDPVRDAAADLTLTVARAEREGKRILLEVGGQW